MAAWANGKPESANDKAKRNALKDVPQRFLADGKPLSYHWHITEEDASIARQIVAYAQRITVLGRGIDSVSYTHLDVYKRQGQTACTGTRLG